MATPPLDHKDNNTPPQTNSTNPTKMPPHHQRKLVTLRHITHLDPIKNHKTRAVATVQGGWTVIVHRDDAFAVGQLVVFFAIDSFIPYTTRRFPWEAYHHMTDFNGERGLHVRSQLLPGAAHLSQGLIQRLAAAPEVSAALDALTAEHGAARALALAQDMAFERAMGVKKWEVAPALQGRVLGRAPAFFARPACVRVQDEYAVFATSRFRDARFQVSEKLDGVSMSVYRVRRGSKWDRSLPQETQGGGGGGDGWRVGVASASQDLDERGDDVYWQAARRGDVAGKVRRLRVGGSVPVNVAVQGELVGPTVKNNSLGLAAHEFIVFQMFDIDKQQLCDPAATVRMCDEVGLPHVPVLGTFRLRDFATTLDEILAKADGVGMRGQTREGLVFKNACAAKGMVFKVISNKWLLEQGE